MEIGIYEEICEGQKTEKNDGIFRESQITAGRIMHRIRDKPVKGRQKDSEIKAAYMAVFFSA